MCKYQHEIDCILSSKSKYLLELFLVASITYMIKGEMSPIQNKNCVIRQKKKYLTNNTNETKITKRANKQTKQKKKGIQNKNISKITQNQHKTTTNARNILQLKLPKPPATELENQEYSTIKSSQKHSDHFFLKFQADKIHESTINLPRFHFKGGECSFLPHPSHLLMNYKNDIVQRNLDRPYKRMKIIAR